MGKVLNKHHGAAPPGAVNIMRPSPLGNPFVIGKDGDRDEVCDKHARYAEERVKRDPGFAAAVADLHGKDVLCCCAPKRCHGDDLLLLASRLVGVRW